MASCVRAAVLACGGMTAPALACVRCYRIDNVPLRKHQYRSI
jgi:hypothetical protein